MKTYEQISEQFGISLSALKRHRLNHVPLYLKVEKETTMTAKDGSTVRAMETTVGGKLMQLDVAGYSKAAAKKFRICTTPEDLEKGKAHSAGVQAYYIGQKEPERWDELVAMVEKAWPGFRVVQ